MQVLAHRKCELSNLTEKECWAMLKKSIHTLILFYSCTEVCVRSGKKVYRYMIQVSRFHTPFAQSRDAIGVRPSLRQAGLPGKQRDFMINERTILNKTLVSHFVNSNLGVQIGSKQ